jgi:hypothetical protein
LRAKQFFERPHVALTQIAHRANSENVKGKLSEQTYEQILDQLQMIGRYLKATLAKVE